MQTQNVFSKNQSSIIKGLAIILMVIHHTFAFPDRISNVNYIPIIFNIDRYIAEFGRICVFMYLFLSGYGLFYCAERDNGITYKNIIDRVIKLLSKYWLIIFLFIPVGIILGVYSFNINQFLMNFFTLSYSYNQEWWFINTYILLILSFPIVYKIIKYKSYIKVIILSLIISFTSIGIDFIMPSIDSILFIKIIRLVCIYQLYFITGCIFCKYKVMDLIYNFVNSKGINKINNYVILVIICMLIRQITSILDFIIGPIFIFSSMMIINKLKIEKLFLFMNKHSTNIWLTHSFLCYYYFQDIVFMPKYAILIIPWIMILSVCLSFIINKIEIIMENTFIRIKEVIKIAI